MAQDLRELFKEETGKRYPMKDGHEERFLDLLDCRNRNGEYKRSGLFFRGSFPGIKENRKLLCSQYKPGIISFGSL